MDDEKEIIFIALSNSYISYCELLETLKESSQEDEIPMVEYLIKKHEELLNKYENNIDKEEPGNTISRPPW